MTMTMTMTITRHPRLDRFVQALTALVSDADNLPAQVLERTAPLMRELVAVDDWLPDAMAVPHEKFYQQYLLYADPQDRFSVVSFVWGPGQQTPVHDHTVWGIIGMLRGAEIGQRYRFGDAGLVADGTPLRLDPGDLDIVSPDIGDVHQVMNAYQDRVSISIHVYGGNIGKIRRHVFQADGSAKDFVSGYSNALSGQALR